MVGIDVVEKRKNAAAQLNGALITIYLLQISLRAIEILKVGISGKSWLSQLALEVLPKATINRKLGKNP